MKREEIWRSYQVANTYSKLAEYPIITVKLTETIAEILPRFAADLRTRQIYVVDSNMKLQGVVRMNDMVRYLFPAASLREDGLELFGRCGMALFTRVRDMYEDDNPFALPIEDIMGETHAVTRTTSLSEAASLLIRNRVNELPVVDENSVIVGVVNVHQLISAFIPHLHMFGTHSSKKLS